MCLREATRSERLAGDTTVSRWKSENRRGTVYRSHLLDAADTKCPETIFGKVPSAARCIVLPQSEKGRGVRDTKGNPNTKLERLTKLPRGASKLVSLITMASTSADDSHHASNPVNFTAVTVRSETVTSLVCSSGDALYPFVSFSEPEIFWRVLPDPFWSSRRNRFRNAVPY
jgi:hypothetical protein